MGSGGSVLKPITRPIEDISNKIVKPIEDISNKIITPIIKPFDPILDPILDAGKKVFEIKKKFLDKIPYANKVLSVLEHAPVIGSKIEMLNNAEKMLDMLSKKQYGEALIFAGKTGIKAEIMSAIPEQIQMLMNASNKLV
jgi:hypothetical protein